MDTSAPQSEQLRFDINSDLPEELSDLVQHIKRVAEELLYHWKSFPIVLPPSVTVLTAEENPEKQTGVVDFSQLFITPSFDELTEIASTTKNLNDSQFESIRRNGEFDVPSIHFPGQVHKWRLSLLLQKGADRCHQTYLGDLAHSLHLLIITARNRFTSSTFSLKNSCSGIFLGLWHILDVFVGMPAVTPGDLNKKLYEEHAKFLVAELLVKNGDKSDWMLFCDHVKERCQMMEAEKLKTAEMRPPSVPYTFISPKGTEVDLRLLNNDLMMKCLQILRGILDRESKGWHVRFKDQLIDELKSENLSNDEIGKRVNAAIAEEYKKRVFDAVMQNEDIDNLQPKLGLLLVQQAKANMIVTRANESIKQNYAKLHEEHRQLLTKTYPVKSKIDSWMKEQLDNFHEDFLRQNQWRPHEKAIEDCRDEKLEQMAYLLHRDLIFKRDREQVLRSELAHVRIPLRTFKFRMNFWLPKHWIIKRCAGRQEEIIPTVIVKQFAQRSASKSQREPYYTVEKSSLCTSSTRYPGWRWVNYILRTWTWTWNTMFMLGIVVPWCSPFSLRALLFRDAFYPDYDLNPANGALCPKESSRTPTLRSRLSQLWAHVRRSREDFEEAPDTGFLGKSLSRYFNCIWNYVIKGALGTAALVVVYPTTCVVLSTASLMAGMTAPLWMPIVTLLTHLFAILFYDYDYPHNSRMFLYLFEAVFFRIILQGFIQPICAITTALALCPVASAAVVAFGALRWSLRTLWDKLMFHIVIKHRARIPATNSFVARRIAGPGLASNFFYQILPQQALAAVEAQLELCELQAWQEAEEKKIVQPRRAYETFVKQCFGCFSADVTMNGVYQNVLMREEQGILQCLHEQINKRKSMLNLGLSTDTKQKIKVNKKELKIIMTQTARLLEQFYPSHILNWQSITSEEFWESKMLEVNDWLGLATQILTEVFSSNFLTPLEDSDTCFRLEVEHVNLSKYISMLGTGDFRDDLSVVNTVLSPENEIDVNRPSLDINIFTPRFGPVVTPHKVFSARPWKQSSLQKRNWLWTDKLTHALPVPHPSLIALLIYNRDNDQDTISICDSTCRQVLQSAEDCSLLLLK